MEKEARPNATVRRRNTLDTIIFNEMCDKADKDCENETKEEVKESSRKCKRSLKLLRGNERDLKLDIEIASYEKCSGNMAIPTPNQIKVYNYNNSNIRVNTARVTNHKHVLFLHVMHMRIFVSID